MEITLEDWQALKASPVMKMLEKLVNEYGDGLVYAKASTEIESADVALADHNRLQGTLEGLRLPFDLLEEQCSNTTEANENE